MTEPATKITAVYAPPDESFTVWLWVTRYETGYFCYAAHDSKEKALQYKPKRSDNMLDLRLYEVALPLAPFGGGY